MPCNTAAYAAGTNTRYNPRLRGEEGAHMRRTMLVVAAAVVVAVLAGTALTQGWRRGRSATDYPNPFQPRNKAEKRALATLTGLGSARRFANVSAAEALTSLINSTLLAGSGLVGTARSEP